MKPKYHQYKQGLFSPLHPEKYKGNGPCVYRSSYESKLYSWFDLNSNIVEWSSESIAIPYISPKDGHIHRYYPDAIIKLRGSDGNIHPYIIEIKPKKQTVAPTNSNRKNPNKLLYEQITYAINTAKWNACKQFCEKNKFKFMIITEDELNSLKF